MRLSSPSAKPTNAWLMSAMMKPVVSSVTALGTAMCGAAHTASDAAMPTFTTVGIMRVLNGGDTNSQAEARTNASENATRIAGSTVNVTNASRSLDQVRDH